jgi:hypothetical protein
METLAYHYMVTTVMLDGLETLLNGLESHASGDYDIVSIFDRQHAGSRTTVCVVIRFLLREDEPVFDEEEIKRKLGF